MNKDDPNVARVELVAKALGDSWHEFVLVGGCAAGLLITDPARPPVRATVDVDLAVEVSTRADYYNHVHDQLVRLGFRETGDVICRWRCGELIVDVMPTEENILGFANIWYGEAVRTAETVELPSGAKIKIITAPLFVATKLEAFFGRGEGNFNESHDVEDIVNVIDGRPEWVGEAAEAGEAVRDYLRNELESLLLTADFLDAIPRHLRPDAASQARREIIIQRLRAVAGL